MATKEYFSTLGFQQDQKLIQQNRNIRKYLRNHKGKVSKSHKARLLKLRSANHAKLFPTDPDTGQSVLAQDKAAQSAARTKYGSSRAAYNSLEGVYNTQLANLDPYFNQYRTHLNNLASSAIQQAQAQQQAIMDQQAQANQQTQAGTDAIVQNAGNNPAAAAALQAGNDAAAGRNALAQNAANAAAERGQIRAAQFNAQSANTGLAQNETRTQINSNMKKLIDDRNALDQQIGDYFQSIKDSNKAAFLDNQLKVQAAKLAGAKFKVDVADKAADNARADAALAEKTANDQTRNAISQQNADQSGSSGSSKSTPYYTPSAKRTAIQSFNKAYSGAKGTITKKVMGSGKYKGRSVRGLSVNVGTDTAPKMAFYALTPENESQIVSFANQKFGDPILAKAMAQMLIYGYVGPKTWDALRKKRGINPKSLGLKKKG